MQTESSKVGMAKQGSIALKMVSPAIPRDPKEKARLEEDLVPPLASASYLIHSSQWRKPHGSL